MQITYVLELLAPTKRKQEILRRNSLEVAKNRQMIAERLKDGMTSLTTANFKAVPLPSAVKNQNIREVKALYKRFIKSDSEKENITFKNNQPIAYNNQNYQIDHHIISMPLYMTKTQRYAFPLKQTERFDELQTHIMNGCKLGKASLFYKNNKWYFAVTITQKIVETTQPNVMGIDIGLRQLAVASIQTPAGEEISRQFHNGNHAGFVRKKYRTTRRSMGHAKKPTAIKRLNNKEQRWITDLNHKISRQLVNLAVQEKVGTLVMENLSNIRQTAYSGKRADRTLHGWSFYALQQFIEYKAQLAGIKVVYISPTYTSQRCSQCSTVEKSNRKGNLYYCHCGNHIHADLNAARNISQGLTEQQSA